MHNFHLVSIIFVIVLASFIIMYPLDSDQAPNQNNQNQSFRGTENYDQDYSKKIHPHIMKIMSDSDPKTMARTLGTSYEEDKIFVYVYLDSDYISNPPNEINIIEQDENVILAKLSMIEIETISDYNSVERVTLPIKMVNRGHAVSQGVSFSFADDMHTAGFTGNGVTVAVIDDSFFTANPEISGNIISSSFLGTCTNMACGEVASNSHGTAVAEIVVDMAPDVSLRLYASKGGPVPFNSAIQDAIDNNVDIITTSVAFFEGSTGASSFYRDGTSSSANKINQAEAAGILVTAANGNQGDKHWMGNYAISPVTPGSIGLGAWESLMNFRPGQSGVQRACLPVADFGDIFVTSWNAWPITTQDYDVFLFNSAMTVLVDPNPGGTFSILDQLTFNIEPIEIFAGTGSNLISGTSCLVLASFSSSENHFFHIDVEGNALDPALQVIAGSLDTPADATGALAVGAIDQSTDILEFFSSHGPTDDSRNKPEICGTDNTLSHQSGLNPFFGTSAASPHVAGAAALLIEQTPGITVDQLLHRLTDEARFNASYSVDNLCGSNSGAVSLQTASTTDVYIPLGVGVPGCEVGSLCYLPSTFVVDQGTQVTWHNGDTAAHTVTSGTPGGGPDGIFDSSLFLAGSTFSHTFKSSRTVNYFCLVHPWMTGQVTVNAVPCSPPGSGDWTITSSCTLSSSSTAPGNVIIQNGAVLTIPSGRSLDIDFVNNFLRIVFPSGIFIKAGGNVT